MARKTKEKIKNTKDKKTLDLDKEIIIGIKTLPEPSISPRKTKKKQSKAKQNENVRLKAGKGSKKNKKIASKSKKNNNQEFELKLGIEDETIKNKKTKKKNVKTKKELETAQKKRKTVFRVIKYLVLASILIGGGIYFLLSPFFNIKEIIVEGNEKISKEEIISLSGINLEENTFKVQNNEVRKSIKQNAYIDTVEIKRKLPDKIQINVKERVTTFMLTFANAYVYLNNQGYILEVSQTKLDVPIVTGFLTKEEDIHPGNRLCEEDLQRLEQALQITKSAESNDILNLITSINIEDKQDYILELKSEKKTVHMGDNSNLSTKMLYIISILEENKGIEGEIFVNTELNNKGAIFRKKI